MVLAAKVGKCLALALVLDFSANLCLVLEFVLLFLWRRKRSGGRGPPSAGKKLYFWYKNCEGIDLINRLLMLL